MTFTLIRIAMCVCAMLALAGPLHAESAADSPGRSLAEDLNVINLHRRHCQDFANSTLNGFVCDPNRVSRPGAEYFERRLKVHIGSP